MEQARRVLPLCWLPLFVACAAGNEDMAEPGALESRDSALLYPTPEDGMPNILFTRKYGSEAWSGGYGSCTASLIAPRVVLTAKHCVKDLNQPVPPASHIAVGVGNDAFAANAQLYRAQSIVVAPGEWPEGDVAVITLEQSLDWIAPLPMKLSAPHDDTGTWATEYGFGRTGTDPNNGRKNRQHIQVDHVTDTGVWVKNAGCMGDSGGPLVNQHGQIIGVYAVLYANAQNDFCADGIVGVFNRIDIVADMINQALQRAQGCTGDTEWCGDHQDNDCDLRVDEGCLPHIENPDAPVLMYEHCNYEGWGVSLEEGVYTEGMLGQRYVPARSVSSLKVKPGYQVTLYTEDERQGESMVMSADESCLVGVNLNDRMVSLRVERVDIPDEDDDDPSEEAGHEADAAVPPDTVSDAGMPADDEDDAEEATERDEDEPSEEDESSDGDDPGEREATDGGDGDEGEPHDAESESGALPEDVRGTCQASPGKGSGPLHVSGFLLALGLWHRRKVWRSLARTRA